MWRSPVLGLQQAPEGVTAARCSYGPIAMREEDQRGEGIALLRCDPARRLASRALRATNRR
jgi:hypothetical protein